MKKTQAQSKKLQLNRETVRELKADELREVQGGQGSTTNPFLRSQITPC